MEESHERGTRVKLPRVPEQFRDTTSYSYHVDNEFYDDLDRFRELFTEEWPHSTPSDWHEVHHFLAREARLIDEGRFDEWLDLFAGDGLYWVPVTAGGGDPRTEVSHAFDDHRRLTDRIYWLRTGLASSQLPASRTRRLLGNIETIDDPEGLRHVRSSFIINEFRAGVAKTYAGWYAHVLRRDGDNWQIRMKMVNLLDSEQYHENLTLVF